MVEGPQPQSKVGAVLRSTSGNFLEMFDFFLFGFYAGDIGRAFFPSGNETTQLLNTFGIFWLGAMMRPLGAVFLGAYVDSVGRRKGLIATLSIMAVGTLLMAFTPSYASIGVVAPVLVVAGRLVQGFSAGVELGGVSVYLAEMATPGHKGFYTSFQSASQQAAIFLAAIIGYALNAALTKQQIADFGWRIPFLIGCLIVPFIFAIRRSLQETPEFLARQRHPRAAEIFRSAAVNWRIVSWGTLLVVLTTVSFYLITVYTPTFGKTVLKLSDADSLVVTLVVAVTNFIWLPIGGAVSDRVGRRAVLLTIAVLATFTAYPALAWLAASPTFGKMLAVELLFSFYFGVYNGAMVVALTEVVPPEVRATCFSLAYSLAAALFGTSTPFVATYLIDRTHDRASPGYWLMAAAVCGVVSTWAIYRSRRPTSKDLPLTA